MRIGKVKSNQPQKYFIILKCIPRSAFPKFCVIGATVTQQANKGTACGVSFYQVFLLLETLQKPPS